MFESPMNSTRCEFLTKRLIIHYLTDKIYYLRQIILYILTIIVKLKKVPYFPLTLAMAEGTYQEWVTSACCRQRHRLPPEYLYPYRAPRRSATPRAARRNSRCRLPSRRWSHGLLRVPSRHMYLKIIAIITNIIYLKEYHVNRNPYKLCRLGYFAGSTIFF